MMARILPREEYERLAGTEAQDVWPYLAETDRVVVIEKDGQIVACHVLMQMWHLECLWVHPAHRKTTVGGRLWHAVKVTAQSMGISRAMTASIDDTVSDLLAHVGASALPGVHYVVPMRS